MDKIAVNKNPMLAEHQTGINISQIRYLLLPTKCEMDFAYKLETYFSTRDSKARFPSLVEEQVPNWYSFPARFANSTENMRETQRKILEQIEEDIKKKREEVAQAYERCMEWKRKANASSHESVLTVYNPYHKRLEHIPSSCKKCEYERNFKYADESVSPYERRLPLSENYQLAIVFELTIPSEIACLRDMIQFWNVKICSQSHFQANLNSKTCRHWVHYSPLMEFDARDGKTASTLNFGTLNQFDATRDGKTADIVHLGSTTKLVTETHYSKTSVWSSGKQCFQKTLMSVL